MDIRCPKCGEPWEIDSLHDEIAARNPSEPWKNTDGKYDDVKYQKYFSAIRQEFRMKGCETFEGAGHSQIDTKRNSLFGDILDLAGDDIDFAASMIEDAETLGLVD